MKTALFLATAALTLSSVPALADNGQIFDFNAQSQAYPSAERLDQKQCFNGKLVTGISRQSDTVLYVQAKTGGIFRLQMPKACDALKAATKVAFRAGGDTVVCTSGAAQMVVSTPAGPQQCRIAAVNRLTSQDVAMLSGAATR